MKANRVEEKQWHRGQSDNGTGHEGGLTFDQAYGCVPKSQVAFVLETFNFLSCSRAKDQLTNDLNLRHGMG